MTKIKSTAIVILALVGCIMGIGCKVSDGRARRVLDDQGFTDVKLGGDAWWSCGKDDSETRSFTAINARGQRIEGVVCCGVWGKACTVRW